MAITLSTRPAAVTVATPDAAPTQGMPPTSPVAPVSPSALHTADGIDQAKAGSATVAAIANEERPSVSSTAASEWFSRAGLNRVTLGSGGPDPARLRDLWRDGAPRPAIDDILSATSKLTTPWGSTVGDEYKQDSGVWEKYNLLRHHTMVLSQFRKYFGDRPLPGMNHAQLELMLSLHDAGKAEAVRHGSKELQHIYTRQLLEGLSTQLPIEPLILQRMIAIIDGDPIGLLLTGRERLPDAAAEVRKMAAAAKMPPADFLKVLTAFYQSDSSSYTLDAGGVKSLDRVYVQGSHGFELNPPEGRLVFTPSEEAPFLALEKELRS